MPTWAYEARSRDGTLVKGVLQGPSRDAALAELDRLALAPVRIRESVPRQGRVPTGVLAGTLRQLADLIRAGVPLLRALRLLGRGKAHVAMARIWNEIADAVADGTPLADAMALHPGAFGDVHTAMVRAGEQGGFLDDVLARLGDLLEAQASLKAKVIGSLIYPAILLLTGVSAVVYAMVAFVPKFKPFFERIEVPMATKLLLGISDFTVNWWPLLLVLLAAMITAWIVASGRPESRRWMQLQLARLPLIGGLMADVALTRTLRVLGSLLGNGVGLIRALDISRETAGHPFSGLGHGVRPHGRAGWATVGRGVGRHRPPARRRRGDDRRRRNDQPPAERADRDRRCHAASSRSPVAGHAATAGTGLAGVCGGHGHLYLRGPGAADDAHEFRIAVGCLRCHRSLVEWAKEMFP